MHGCMYVVIPEMNKNDTDRFHVTLMRAKVKLKVLLFLIECETRMTDWLISIGNIKFEL